MAKKRYAQEKGAAIAHPGVGRGEIAGCTLLLRTFRECMA